ncbi:ewing's tumor-associated antigen 1 homolog [Notolabrus celidotus]|uniref:ewing's tumor-associated antigen 1 homolog n=1 Tax=Notolabrus celidotus TaxID=1203425 RepID=UPI0014906DDE|nr:ewing's tumor-associated antigen 1 homolog [Notolabrus celidotus]
MNRGNHDPPSGLTSQAAATPKPNRLRRSYRQTQRTQTQRTQTPGETTEPPRTQQSEFKTPTRIPRSRAGGGFSGESPQNDSDFQQDIIWDATSPSPNRPGKRGKKPAGIVNISEIVSRIAPKHGRPKVAEPVLQQWIGDTIPCTPDGQVPKPKKKSPRPNGVDDLLKLAQQFDLNMFRRDEEEVEEQQQQSLELLSEDILDFESGDQSDFLPPLQPAVNAAGETVRHDQPDLQMDDDLDFLFDGPTQPVSGNFSQVSQVKLPLSASAAEASGKASASSHAAAAPMTNAKAAPANDAFEDDWENDDLLNDSLVLEMTQNPLLAAPKHCSTQKPPPEKPDQNPRSAPVSFGSKKVGKEHVRQRETFRLDSNPRFSASRSQTDSWTDSKVGHSLRTAGTDPQQAPPGASGRPGSQYSWQKSNTGKSDPQRPGSDQRTSAAQSFPQRPAGVSSHSEADTLSDLLDEDLNSFFSSDPVWDDPADDDLLCEMCEDVENQIQSAHNVSIKQTPPTWTQRAALQPAIRTWDNQTQQPANQKPFPNRTPPSAAGGSYSMKTDSFRNTQTRNTSGSTSSRVQTAPLGNLQKDQFTFKKPNSSVSTGTRTDPGKCSAAEIELKKKQAMERRRQRLQVAQNLRAPT